MVQTDTLTLLPRLIIMIMVPAKRTSGGRARDDKPRLALSKAERI